MPQRDGPHALSLIICEKIERERPESPATYVGVTNLLQAKGVPGQHGGAITPTPRLHVEARFAPGHARGPHRFALRVRLGETAPQSLISREIRLVDARQEIRLARMWELKRVPSGPIWFEALIDDEVAMRVPFMVEVVPSPSADLQA